MFFGYASLVTALARNILFVPIYLHSIPLVEYGAWLATGGALATIIINDFGLSGVVTQKMSAAFGAGDMQALGSLTGSALSIGVLLALGLTTLSLLAAPWIPGLDVLTPSQHRIVFDCFLIAVAANALGIMGATAGSVLRSLQRVVLVGSIVLAADVAFIAVTLLALFNGAGLYAIAVGLLVRSGVVAVTAFVAVLVTCAGMQHVTVRVQSHAVRGLVGGSGQLFLSSVAMKLQSQGNVFFVGTLLGPASAAIYSLTVRAHETVLMLIGQINAALVPSVTHLFGSGNLTRFRTVLQRVLISIALVTAFAMTMTVVLNEEFLRLWIGDHAFAGQGVSILMAVALFVSSLGFVAYDALLAQGQFGFVSRVFIVVSVLQMLLLTMLPYAGLWLAPLLVLGSAAVWGCLFWIRVWRSIDLKRSEILVLSSELTRIAVVSAVAAAAFVALYPETKSWLGLLTEAMACALVVTGGYFAVSSNTRALVREELGMTISALRAN